MDIIDRRENPKGKSLTNRQRFVHRQQGEIKEAVRKALKDRKLGGQGSQEIIIPDTGEPTFRPDGHTGKRDYVVPGNEEHVVGDHIYRPPYGIGRPMGGAPDGGGEHDFRITINYDEFVRLFLEDMGLPDLLKEAEGDEEKTKPSREGYARYGATQNLHLPLTARNALARRIALKRPSIADLQEAEKELVQRIAEGANEEKVEEARLKLGAIKRRREGIPFIDTIDQRFRRYEQKPAPSPQAVMFCMMDVSGSMDEHRQELAKRFFLLMKIFLERKYKRLDLVFIRHTHYAKEVDEDKFFNDPESGGTVISTALEAMQRIIRERYSPEHWNIYGAQISDGFNWEVDDNKCLLLMTEMPYGLLHACQFFAYVQVNESKEQREAWQRWMKQHGEEFDDEGDYAASLWTAYETLLPNYENFAMQKAAEKEDIVPVFAKLFSRNKDKIERSPSGTLAALALG